MKGEVLEMKAAEGGPVKSFVQFDQGFIPSEIGEHELMAWSLSAEEPPCPRAPTGTGEVSTNLRFTIWKQTQKIRKGCHKD